jgi:hypothetical protein
MKTNLTFKAPTNSAAQAVFTGGHKVLPLSRAIPCGPLSFTKEIIMEAQPKRKRQPAYKAVERKSTILACLEDGSADIVCLAEEIDEWASNMEDGNLGETEKCQTLRETADTLGNYEAPNLEDIPGFLLDVEITVTEMVNRNKRRSPSRAWRMSNAVAIIRAAQENLQEYIDNLPSNDDLSDSEQEARDLREEAISLIATELDEVEHVEFPGMFG